MKLGVVLPHNEIGNDAGAIRAYAQGIEALGAQHLLERLLGGRQKRVQVVVAVQKEGA